MWKKRTISLLAATVFISSTAWAQHNIKDFYGTCAYTGSSSRACKQIFSDGTRRDIAPIEYYKNETYADSDQTRDSRLIITFCGPWLDLTDAVRVTGHGVRFDRILAKGVYNRGSSTEVTYVTIQFNMDKRTYGDRTIKLNRPGIPNQSDYILNIRP